eukprot:5267368-Amphidinium_carterae.2
MQTCDADREPTLLRYPYGEHLVVAKVLLALAPRQQQVLTSIFTGGQESGCDENGLEKLKELRSDLFDAGGDGKSHEAKVPQNPIMPHNIAA